MPLCFSNDARFVNPDPNRFASSFAKFQQEDESKYPEEITSLFLREVQALEGGILYLLTSQSTSLNRGFGGAHISDVLHFYNHLFPRYKPDRIVFERWRK